MLIASRNIATADAFFCLIVKEITITAHVVKLSLLANCCLAVINECFAFSHVLVVSISVLECVAETAVRTLNRLADLVRAPQMERFLSAVTEALLAGVTLQLAIKQNQLK